MQTLYAEESEQTIEAIETAMDADTRLVSVEIAHLRGEIDGLRKALGQPQL
jgi:hypothetical protein